MLKIMILDQTKEKLDQIKDQKEPSFIEEVSSKDKNLEKLLIPIKEYLETNAPKNLTQERLLDIIREIIAENSGL